MTEPTKYALVTGGSRGIGREICLKLARSGYYVLINYRSNADEAQRTLEGVRAAGGDGETLRFDVAAGEETAAALAVWYLCRMKTVKPEKGDFRLRASLCTRMLTRGITSFLSQISLVAAMAAINNMLRKYGALDEIFSQEQYAQIPMAVVGIVMKFFQIVISIVVGMAAGCIPVVGYNMGAGKKTRVRELFTKLLLCEAIVGAVALVLAEGFPRQLIAVFGAANESSYYTDFAIKAFRTYLCMMVLACVNKACFIFLQAVGKAFSSTMLSMVREVVFGVGFALLLPRFFGLDGVLYSMSVSDVLTFVIATVMIVKPYRELNTEGATVL